MMERIYNIFYKSLSLAKENESKILDVIKDTPNIIASLEDGLMHVNCKSSA